MISGSKLNFRLCLMQTQHCWPRTPSIVVCYMLRPFTHPVACCSCCWELLRKVWNWSNFWANNDNKTFIIKRVLDKPRILSYNTTAGTLHPTRSGEECSEGEGGRNPEEMGTTQQVYFRLRRANTPRVQAVSSGLNNTFQPASVCYRCTFAWNGMLIILIDRNYHEMLFKKKKCLTRPGTNWVGSWKRLCLTGLYRKNPV